MFPQDYIFSSDSLDEKKLERSGEVESDAATLFTSLGDFLKDQMEKGIELGRQYAEFLNK